MTNEKRRMRPTEADSAQYMGEMPITRPSHMRRKKENTSLLRFVRGCILTLCATIAVLGLLLIVLPMFRVKEIKVEGASFHSAQQITEASGIETGDEMLTINKNEVNQKIWAACPQVNGIRIVRSFSTVKIVVTEYEDVMYTEVDDKYYAVSRDMIVVDESDDENDFAGLCKIELPKAVSFTRGKPVVFANQESDLSYVTSLIDTLKANGVMEQVTSIDASQKYNVSYVTDGKLRVELGKVSELAVKLQLVNEILEREALAEDSGAVVDVANVKKPTCRPIMIGELSRN